ncbi:MAG: zinc ABC transporter substrate-binding protein [Nesterenkonia sp.]|nr:zinc ABC transporter substrate-binding protein [Nesterenkonia sp.]
MTPPAASAPPVPTSRPVLTLGGLGVAALVLSACGGAADGGGVDDVDADGDIVVVASTDVYADLAAGVVGDRAEVEAVIDDAAVDPHSYEATPQDRLAVEGADVIIANGGGYDPFLTDLAASADREDRVVRLVEGEGDHEHEHGDEHDEHHDDDGYEDEHVWYDLDRMEEFVLEFGDHMAELDADHADQYRGEAESLAEEIAALSDRAAAVDAEGLSYLATEPASQHLLHLAGFADETDPQFLAAVEHGDDVSPRLHRQALDTASAGEIDLLAFTVQTETAQARAVRAAAEDAGVPVLEFSETVPEEHEGYLDWMEANIDAVEELAEDAHGG